MILLSDTLTLTTNNSNGFATSRPSKAKGVPWNSWWTKQTNEKTHWNPFGSRPFNKMVDFQGCFLWPTSAFFCWQLSNSWCSPTPLKEKCTKRHLFSNNYPIPSSSHSKKKTSTIIPLDLHLQISNLATATSFLPKKSNLDLFLFGGWKNSQTFTQMVRVFMVIFVPWDRIRKTKSPTKQIKRHQKTNIQVTWIPTPLVTPKCSFMVSSLAIWAKSRSHFDFLESSWYEDPTPFQDPLPAASMGPMVYLPYMNG